MLTAQQHQGLHGEGFVFALASAAGLVVSRPSLDVEGIDWLISFPGRSGNARHPKIEVQVKTCTSPAGDETSWSYRMRAGHFNALAGTGFMLPRYLVLVVVPGTAERYATCDDDGLHLTRAAYWTSLADRAELPDGVATTTVSVPHRNRLSPDSLVELVAGTAQEAVR